MTATFEGKDCVLRHGGQRFVTTRKCVECVRLGRRRNLGRYVPPEPEAPGMPPPNVAHSDFIKPITKEMLQGRRAP